MGRVRDSVGQLIARYLQRPVRGYEPFTPSDPEALRQSLAPGDVLLVEGNNHISGVIKYLTQSTWSHSALYVGPIEGRFAVDGEPHVLIEANVGEGVVSAPLSKYFRFHTRICRPVGLDDQALRKVIDYAVARIGKQYDSRRIIDLARYLFPYPPVPVWFRRRMLAIGSGDPTKAICSTLIAEAFASIRYPILPERVSINGKTYGVGPFVLSETEHIRKHGLYTPRDFDVSPFFAIVKPTLAAGFDYHTVQWGPPGVAPADLEEAAE